MAFSGVRSSCDIAAKNWLLAELRRFFRHRLCGSVARAALGRAPLGQISGDRHVADQLARAIVQSGDQDIRPERRAVLSNAPTVLLDLSNFRRDLELLLRRARRDVGRRIELGEMRPDDLSCAVALEPFGARIPCRDVAVQVEHEDGVVAHPFDDEPESLLALAQCLFGFASLGEISGHLGEPGQLASFVAERRDHHVGPESRSVLPNPPALVLEASCVRGGAQLELGESPGDQLARVEDGEVLPDDLGGGVALDALGAGVPAQDVPVGVQCEDGVIPNAFDERAIQVALVHREAPWREGDSVASLVVRGGWCLKRRLHDA
jgi:hypothetical protein